MVRFLKHVGPLTFFISSPMAKAFDSDFPYRYVRRRDFRLLTAQSVGNWEEEEEGCPRKMLSLWALGSGLVCRKKTPHRWVCNSGCVSALRWWWGGWEYGGVNDLPASRRLLLVMEK